MKLSVALLSLSVVLAAASDERCGYRCETHDDCRGKYCPDCLDISRDISDGDKFCMPHYEGEQQFPKRNEQLSVMHDLATGLAEGRGDGNYYGAPTNGRCAEENEVVYTVKGLEGAWCAPPCRAPYGSCPWSKPDGTTAEGECAFQPHPKPAHSHWPEGWRCALICHKGLKCPPGATCQIFGGGFGTGTCTYPFGNATVV